MEKKKSKLTIHDIERDVFSFLEDYPNMGFYFAKFPEQTFDISINNLDYSLFGKCWAGYFLTDEKGCVVLFQNKEKHFSDSDFIYTNNSLPYFLKSYSLFMSGIFLLKANREIFLEMIREVSSSLVEKISLFDKPAAEETNFWGIISYLIDDCGIKINIPVSKYIESDRFQPNS